MKRFVTVFVFAALVLTGMSALSAPQPAAAQSGAVWRAEFFNNNYLFGSPVFTTQYTNLELYWGQSAPGPGVNADNFSTRIATDVTFAAGTYRFYLLADDGAQLWIDFPPSKQPALSSINSPVPGQMLTVDVTLQAGLHHLQVDLVENTGDAYVYLRWANLATNPGPPTFPVPVNVGTAGWTAQYFSNPSLAGNPVVTQSESSPTHQWGTNAPASGVPADSFSARWTSVQNLTTGGLHEVRVTADDGVRVWVDSSLVMDEWHGATGQLYVRQVNLTAGQHVFIVEFYEAVGDAYLNFNLVLPGGIPAPGQPPANPTGVTLTVVTYRLNVRSTPSLSGQILTQITRGQTYPALGRNTASTWFQVNVNGTVGWVSGSFVQVNNEAALPVTDGASVPTPTPVSPPPTGNVVVARYNVNIRSGPGVSFGRLTYLPTGQTAELLGRNANSTWLQVRYGAFTGWLSTYYINLGSGVILANIPVTG